MHTQSCVTAGAAAVRQGFAPKTPCSLLISVHLEKTAPPKALTGPQTALMRAQYGCKTRLKGNRWGCTDDVAQFLAPGQFSSASMQSRTRLKSQRPAAYGSLHPSRPPELILNI
jgi:hypothetical protein